MTLGSNTENNILNSRIFAVNNEKKSSEEFYFCMPIDLERPEVVGVMCTYVKWILVNRLGLDF